MAGDSKKLQPIIVKRVKRAGHGAHGGAWKIAYADFVTAMMAFFLLMWLLGSTTEGDRKGIADYFQNPLKVALLADGSGAGDAASVVKGGGTDLTRSAGQVKRGEIDEKRKTINLQTIKHEARQAEAARLEALRKKMQETIANNPRLAALSSQIRLDMTPDGLRIQIVDEQNRAMFDTGSAAVKPYMRELLHEIAQALADVPNRLTIEGHTDAAPFAGGERGYSNWELSSDRANASRRELLAAGLPEARVLRVQGLAASALYDRDAPLAAVNRRISIIVMNREAEDRLLASGAQLAQALPAVGAPSADAPAPPATASEPPR